MFITALTVNAPNWEQPWRLPTGELLNNLWYICTMEYYSAVKGNDLAFCEKAQG